MKPQPTKTSFDLLEGAFAKVRRARLIRLVSLGFAAAMAIGVSSQAVVVQLTANEVRSDILREQSRASDLRSQLSTEADVGGLTRGDMESYLETLGADVARAAQRDVPLQAFYATLDAVTPANIAVSTTNLESTETGTRVTIQGTTEAGYGAALAWRESLRAAPQITEVEESWSGSEDSLSVTMAITLGQAAATDRSSRYIREFTLEGVLPDESVSADDVSTADEDVADDEDGDDDE